MVARFLGSIGDAVIAGDTAGCVTFLNPVAASLTGWEPAEALGQPVTRVFQIINEQTREPAEDLVARVLRENGIVALANHTALVTRDGREVPVEDSAAPITDAAGRVAGVVIVSTMSPRGGVRRKHRHGWRPSPGSIRIRSSKLICGAKSSIVILPRSNCSRSWLSRRPIIPG